MKLNLQSYRTSLVTLAAMAALVACLVFTVGRLLNVEGDLRSEDTHTNLWQITQAQFEATLFVESLTRRGAGEPLVDPESEPDFRLAILISRMAVLLEGPQAQIIDKVGMLAGLKLAYLELSLAEPVVGTNGLDAQAALNMRAQARDLAYELRSLANKVMLLNREQGAMTRNMYLRVVFESLAFIIGIVISASFLLLRLFKGLQEANHARRLLRQEQELSDLVINNIAIKASSFSTSASTACSGTLAWRRCWALSRTIPSGTTCRCSIRFSAGAKPFGP